MLRKKITDNIDNISSAIYNIIIGVISMIKYFEVSGFKNFSDKLSFDFSNVRDYKFNKQCITKNLVGKAIVYGKNSVGKTNLGLAIFDIVSHLTNKNVTPDLYDYYLNSDSQCGYAEFLYIFQFLDDIIEYSYRKDEKQILVYEKLVLNNQQLFEFDYSTQSGDTSGIEKLAPTLNWSFRDTECILKYVVNNTVLEDSHPLRCMVRFVSNMLWFRNLDQNRYIGYKTNCKDYFDFVFDKDILNEFQDFLQLTGIKEKLVVLSDTDGKKSLYFDTKKPLPFFKTASSGTRALYTFFYWYKTTKDVSFIYIDEFDAYYHFELSEAIVSILEKMSDTQVVITSHNTNLMTNRIMRPDCYFILSQNKITSFSDATDRELREGHNLEKLYMSGEFDG